MFYFGIINFQNLRTLFLQHKISNLKQNSEKLKAFYL